MLHKKESETVEAVDKIKDELTKENNRLRIELRSLDEQYKQKLDRLQSWELKLKLYFEVNLMRFFVFKRNKEIALKRTHDDEFNSLNADHLRQKQLLVNEF